MKFNVEIDCTPEEARQFFGLPDVRPMQEALMKRIERQMLEGLEKATPEALLKAWMPGWSPTQAQEMMTAMMRASFGGVGRPEGS